jgi:methionyl-tRNA synthetase
MSKKTFTVTAALPYANGPLHIGHIAGAYLPADIFVRYQKSIKNDVAFICGSDEHGAAITIQAKKNNVKPKDIINKYHTLNKESFEKFGIEFSIYDRTSDKLHHETAKETFNFLEKKNIFTKKTTMQFYDLKNNQFLADRYIIGECPKCSSDEAYGDQCEKCGSALSPDELIDPKSTLSGEKPILKETTHWYLPMQKHEDWLKEWLLSGVFDNTNHHDPKNWRSQVLGQCKSWIDGGLKERAMTRDLDWGVKVPIENADGKVLYVWLDAPIGYISATIKWAKENNLNWEKYWKNNESNLIHFIGKDNIVFHCIIFPIMLHASGEYILPENVPANEFLNLEGQKISTSKNWAVWLHEYLEEFPEHQDVLRYVLTANAPETKDNDFTWDEFQARNNNELVAIYGNFINRVVVLTHKYYAGEVPKASELLKIDRDVLSEMRLLPKKIGTSIELYRFREASQLLMQLARIGNKYLADSEPWKLIKSNPERVKTIMNTALQIATGLSVISEPILPFTASKLKNMLNLNVTHLKWKDVSTNTILIPSGHLIRTAKLLFQKVEDEQMEFQRSKLKASSLANKTETVTILPLKPKTSFENFAALDLKVAVIVAAKKVSKTKKLMEITVRIGSEERTVVSGIALDFNVDELIGKKVTLLTNLQPRTLKGIESNGMILLGENNEGHFVFVSPEAEDTKTGLSIH